MKVTDDLQDYDAILKDRVPKMPFPAEIKKHDVIFDEGYLKEVDHLDIRQNGTRVFVWFAEGSPGSASVTCVGDRPALVLRLASGDG